MSHRHRTKPIDDTLYVVAAVFNPRRYARRYELFRQFAEHVSHQPRARLITVELALGDRPFEVTEAHNPDHIRYRTNDEWFIKENLLNIGFRHLPREAKYMAWVDADIQFTHPDWADATIHALQHHPVVQMFTQVVNLGPDYQPFQYWHSFAHSFMLGRKWEPCGHDYNHWHPGFGWAYTREALTAFGGLMDRAILGAADHHMAAALIGQGPKTVHAGCSDAMKRYVETWQGHARKYLRHHGHTIGCVAGTINHYWHGSMKSRRYVERVSILTEHQFDPYRDLIPDLDGLLHLSHRSPGLRADIQHYLAGRSEDCIYFDGTESTL